MAKRSTRQKQWLLIEAAEGRIGWRVLQELLASLDTEDFSEENRQITFFD